MARHLLRRRQVVVETGRSVRLPRAAVAHAREHGATTVEGYPVEPLQGQPPDASAWTGTVSAFHRAGFSEVARRADWRETVRALRRDHVFSRATRHHRRYQAPPATSARRARRD